MYGTIPTKLVRNKESGVETVINASDFNAEQHEEVKGEAGQPHLDIVRAAQSARTVAELDEISKQYEGQKLRDGKGKKSAAPDDFQEYLARKRQILELEEGPRFIRQVQPPTPQSTINNEPFVPYMAPPSPGVALRTNGVDPALHAAMGQPLRVSEEFSKAGGQPVGGQPEHSTSDGGFDVTTSRVTDVKEHLAGVNSIEELDKLEQAESDGPGRVGVLEAISKRRDQLKATEE